MRFYKTHSLIKKALSQLTWEGTIKDKTIYLTFDDGPIPEVTKFVLDTLAEYQARATFFCVGDNVGKYPEIYQQVIQAGHRVGNHTFNHIDGWKTDTDLYLNNVKQCQKFMAAYLPKHLDEHSFFSENPPLFRPPYGKMTPQQIRRLSADYQIVMWDVLTYDFDATLSRGDCLEGAMLHTKPGSIVVFHDSVKSIDRLKFVLPRYLKYFQHAGYRFECL